MMQKKTKKFQEGCKTGHMPVSCHLTDWTTLCSLLCDRQQGSVKPTAGRRVTVSREGVGVNTFGVIENTPRVFEISFGILYFSVGKLEFNDTKMRVYR